jgi:hypothetical protein
MVIPLPPLRIIFHRNSGWIFSVSLALYLFYQRGILFPTFLSICGVVLQFNQQEKLTYLFFFLLEISFFFSSGSSRSQRNEIDSEIVQFKPYEAEIRQYLLQKDPSLLHRVDGLLLKYEGKEDELMRKLKSKYEITSHTSSTSVLSSVPSSSAPPLSECSSLPSSSLFSILPSGGLSRESERENEPILHLHEPISTSTKWGPFDSTFSQPATSSSQRHPSPFSDSSPSATARAPSSSSSAQQPSFSFFSPHLHSSNSSERYREPERPTPSSTSSQPQRRSGQYGAFIDEDQDDSASFSSPFSQPAAHSQSYSHYTTAPAVSSSQPRHSLSHPLHQSHSQQQQQPHHPEVLFHAQTNEVDQAKRMAKEAMQWRINQRLQHK